MENTRRQDFNPIAVRLARAQMGDSLRAFAQRFGGSGLSYATIARWEAGERLPSCENLIQLAAITGKPVQFFFSPIEFVYSQSNKSDLD